MEGQKTPCFSGRGSGPARERFACSSFLFALFPLIFSSTCYSQQTGGLVQACYPGTLWETLRAQSNVTVWSDSIMFTGLNQMLDVPTPGQILFAVRDSGLYQCVFGADVACMTQKKNWYASLTSPIGVGLLMLHWLPNASQPLTGPDHNQNSFQTYMTIAMNNTLNGTLDATAWNVVTSHHNSSVYPSTISLPSNQTANSSLGGTAQANIISVVPTCSGNGTLYILDSPLVPAGFPETSVNALPELKDFCWTNILTLANDPANGVDYLATMLTIYSPILLNSFLDPRSNATWLIANSAASEAIGNQFADYATKNPSDFQMLATSQVLLHMLPGGYCPDYLAGRSFRPFVGIIWNKDYLLNFSYIGPNELKIHNVNTDQNSTVTGKFLGTACYSTVYELSDNLHQWSMSNLSAVPRTSDSYLTAMPTVGSQALLYGVEQTCNGTNVIQRNTSITMPASLKANSIPVPYATAVYGNAPPAELSAPPQPSTPPSTAPASGSSSSSLSRGAIAGIVIAAIAGLGALTFLLILFVRKQRKNKRHKHDPDFADCDKESTIPSSPFKLTMFPTVSPVRIKSASGSDTISPIDSGPLAEEASLQTSNSDTPSLPSLPWHEFIIEPKGLEFLRNPDTGERLILGSGRFGRVYRGILNGTEPVAIKCIDDETVGASAKDLERGLAATVPRQATTPRERVMREIALLKACRSQYIVSFLGVCFQMGEVQLVMELMSGGDLWGRIHHSEWGGWFKGGREIAVDVAMGLSFLHAKRVVHLDLKSSNILLRNSNGGVGGGPSGAKLTDVGLSKILPISREYIASTAGGTWHWCAPEIILGQKCTPAADIWSFGVVVWELCTGEAPLRGQLRAVKVPEECPQEVEELINRCWSTDPEKRPTAVEIVRILNGSNTQALSIRGSDGSIGPSDTDTILSSSPPPAAANSQMKILSRNDNVV